MTSKLHIAKCWHPASQSNWYELRDSQDNCYHGSHNRQECVDRQKQLEAKLEAQRALARRCNCAHCQGGMK